VWLLSLCDQGDLLNEVGSGVGQWVQQQAEELSKLQQGAADVLGGVVQKAGDSIKSGKIVSTARSCMLLCRAAGRCLLSCELWLGIDLPLVKP
jgi:hypothetical protein